MYFCTQQIEGTLLVWPPAGVAQTGPDWFLVISTLLLFASSAAGILAFIQLRNGSKENLVRYFCLGLVTLFFLGLFQIIFVYGLESSLTGLTYPSSFYLNLGILLFYVIACCISYAFSLIAVLFTQFFTLQKVLAAITLIHLVVLNVGWGLILYWSICWWS